MDSKRTILSALVVSISLLMAFDAFNDELFMSSGRKLRHSHKSYIEGRIKKLRSDTDYRKRFENIQYLIRLGRTVLPSLIYELDNNSNPMLVRCAALALSEIGGPEAAPALERVISSSSKGRDEKVMAALGLGKQKSLTDIESLRSLIEPGESRFVRKSAALALARLKDKPSASALLNLAKKEREDKLASVFLLSALIIGGEETVKAVPQLFRSFKSNRRKVLALGSAFLAEPALLPFLLKDGSKEKKLEGVLAVVFGRYPSREAADYLEMIIRGGDLGAAADALYSMGFQDKDRAIKLYSSFLANSRSPSVKAHCFFALAEVDLANRFVESLRAGLKDPDPQVRSAAALSLIRAGDEEAAEYIEEVLQRERRPAVVADLLLALGFVGGAQHVEQAEFWAERGSDKEPGTTARLVKKVLSGKTDTRILEERLEKRLTELSARWHLRFRDRVNEQIWWGFELDQIVLISYDDPGGGEPQEKGGGDPGGGDDPGGGSGGGDTGGDDPTPPGGTGQETGSGKKKLYRYEVIEWDLVEWFTHYPYFPETFFRPKK